MPAEGPNRRSVRQHWCLLRRFGLFCPESVVGRGVPVHGAGEMRSTLVQIVEGLSAEWTSGLNLTLSNLQESTKRITSPCPTRPRSSHRRKTHADACCL